MNKNKEKEITLIALVIKLITETSQFTKAMQENNLLEDIIPIDKKFKIC